SGGLGLDAALLAPHGGQLPLPACGGADPEGPAHSGAGARRAAAARYSRAAAGDDIAGSAAVRPVVPAGPIPRPLGPQPPPIVAAIAASRYSRTPGHRRLQAGFVVAFLEFQFVAPSTEARRGRHAERACDFRAKEITVGSRQVGRPAPRR